MTGTPSRTATAYDDGITRRSEADSAVTPRGYVGRKLQAMLRSEEHEVHMRQPKGGRGSLAVQSPKSSGPEVVNATDMWSKSHASYPGRSACLSARPEAKEA